MLQHVLKFSKMYKNQLSLLRSAFFFTHHYVWFKMYDEVLAKAQGVLKCNFCAYV